MEEDVEIEMIEMESSLNSTNSDMDSTRQISPREGILDVESGYRDTEEDSSKKIQSQQLLRQPSEVEPSRCLGLLSLIKGGLNCSYVGHFNYSSSSGEDRESKQLYLTMLQAFFVLVACFLFNDVFRFPVCDFLFKCGCTWMWRGGDHLCNIHNPDIEWAKKCPWCRIDGIIGAANDFILMLIMLIVYIIVWYKVPARTYYRWFWAILSYFISAMVVGFLFKVITNYPHFIFY
eukprot:TRINITY_DN2931_c0_g1_i1.p1 TRINITY_DN2931_c0_g1~~TRINITY_DN2931_c0_g1_i1.p1  ORF type:complete len:233 (-),score=8.75 TRINITY_DN2931_c0_g1_i1:108-806(-)